MKTAPPRLHLALSLLAGLFAATASHAAQRYADRFDDPNLPGEMTVTITLKPVLCGTDLTAVQEGIPDAIPTEMCYLGWQESLAQLAKLVEPEIPG